jgi:hypothetical protein
MTASPRRRQREALPAWVLSNLAGLLTETNRHAEAEPLYRRALAIFEKSFGRQQSFAVRFRLWRMEPLGRRVMMPATRSS